jgi:hypothetical protein
MNPIPGLMAELEQARAKVGSKTFAEATEAFKAIESVKARIRHAKAKFAEARAKI